MSVTHSEKRRRFRELHAHGCFVLPNPWDVGGARRLATLGFEALASTSAGLAWSLGKRDGQLSRDEVLAHLSELCAATDLPVNADFETGYAQDPDQIVTNVRMAIETGIAGLSIEDRAGRQLAERDQAIARVRAARRAIDQSGADVILVGRSEGYFLGIPDLTETIARLQAYAEVGADCLYAPGAYELSDIEKIVAAVRPKPVNVMINGPQPTVASLAAIGVRRVSVGASLAAAAWHGFDAAAQMLRSNGTLPRR